MRYVLDVLYLVLLVLLAPYLLVTALRTGKYRQGWRQKLLGHVPRRSGNRPCLWVHAVSVGEVNLVGTLLERWEAEHPDWDCVLSTTTRTGYEVACRKYAPRTVFYCPLDFSWAVRNALRRVRPDLLVLAELELWPNLIGAAKEQGVPVAVINGRLGEKSFRGYRRIAPLARRVIGKLDAVAAQDESCANRFRQLGAAPERVLVTGSLKFDGAQSDRSNPATLALRKLWRIEPDDVIFLAGSTQEPEERMALEVFRLCAARYPALRCIITPRHPERFEAVAAELDRSGIAWDRRTRLKSPDDTTARVLLVDTVGELSAWWGTADIAFVGGSMGARGGQNMLEPAAYGAAVSFGPNTWNFRDIVRLLLEGEAAVVVHDGESLRHFVERCLRDQDYRRRLGRRASALVARHQGATEKTLDFLHARLGIAPAAAWRAAG